jgi:glycosyltransferase involved in cell wall biosynthesis
MKDVREILSNFDFYLCCPGVVMPLCHNVIEAMSVGTIPVIQKEYAEVMYPALKNFTNAIVFNDKDDLVATIEIVLQLPEEKKLTMKKSVLEYYSNYLSPKGMTTQLNIALSKNKKIYLQAEHRSVKFLK